jgi:hypothetical protein
MTKTSHFLGFAFLGLALSLSSCKKDNEDALDSDNVVVQDNMEASSTAEDISGTVQQLMEENSNVINGRMAAGDDTITKMRGLDSCALVTIIKSQKKMTVDFGTDGCMGRNGRTRKGKWIIKYTDHMKNPGAVVEVAFENFGFKRPGQNTFVQVSNASTKKITTLSVSNGVYESKKEINMTMILPAGQTRSHIGTRYVSWNTNQTPFNRYDDVITIKTTSTETGTDRKGRAYNVVITNPIVIKTECWLQYFFKPVSGTLQIQKIGRTKTIDYGDGTCGGVIGIDVGGKKQTIGEGE